MKHPERLTGIPSEHKTVQTDLKRILINRFMSTCIDHSQSCHLVYIFANQISCRSILRPSTFSFAVLCSSGSVVSGILT